MSSVTDGHYEFGVSGGVCGPGEPDRIYGLSESDIIYGLSESDRTMDSLNLTDYELSENKQTLNSVRTNPNSVSTTD